MQGALLHKSEENPDRAARQSSFREGVCDPNGLVHRVIRWAPAIAAIGIRLKAGFVDENPICRATLSQDRAQLST